MLLSSGLLRHGECRVATWRGRVQGAAVERDFGYRASGNETIISLMTTIQGQHTNAHERDKFHHDENTKRVSSNSMSPFENVNIMRVNNMMPATSEVSYYNKMMYTTSAVPSHSLMHTPTNNMMPTTSAVPSHSMMHTPTNKSYTIFKKLQ